MVIQDEARNVHYGVLALREHVAGELTEGERREREDWAFEVALLMRHRFMAYEVYDEYFAHRLPGEQWRKYITKIPGMREFRQVMLSRLVPTLREIGLLTPRVIPRYGEAGLMRSLKGASAEELTGEQRVRALDATA